MRELTKDEVTEHNNGCGMFCPECGTESKDRGPQVQEDGVQVFRDCFCDNGHEWTEWLSVTEVCVS